MKNYFQYAAGRFVNPDRIISANIYTKQIGTSEKDGSPINAIRVAIDLDTQNVDKSCVYSGEFPSTAAAEQFIDSIPVNQSK